MGFSGEIFAQFCSSGQFFSQSKERENEICCDLNHKTKSVLHRKSFRLNCVAVPFKKFKQKLINFLRKQVCKWVKWSGRIFIEKLTLNWSYLQANLEDDEPKLQRWTKLKIKESQKNHQKNVHGTSCEVFRHKRRATNENSWKGIGWSRVLDAGVFDHQQQTLSNEIIKLNAS